LMFYQVDLNPIINGPVINDPLSLTPIFFVLSTPAH